MDDLEREIRRNVRRNVLLQLITELYDVSLSDSISVKEWLQRKLNEGSEDEDGPRCTNHFLCPRDSTRWDARWSCLCNDRCPTCDGVVEPYATTRNSDQSETIHNRAVYDRANAVGHGGTTNADAFRRG